MRGGALETARLDPDELAALDAIIAFIRKCENDAEVVAAMGLAEAGRSARAVAAVDGNLTPITRSPHW